MPNKLVVYFSHIYVNDIAQGYLMSPNFHKISGVLDRIEEAISIWKDFDKKITYEKISIVHEGNPKYTTNFVNMADAIKEEDIIYFPISIVKNGMLIKIFGIQQENDAQFDALQFGYEIYKFNSLIEAGLICDLILSD